MSHHYIKYDNVHFSYPDSDTEVLKGISFLITHGEKIALLGKNGAGKSTLILTLNGLLTPSEGEINIGGIPATRKTLPRIREAVGLVFQNPDDQLFMSTIEEDVAFGPLNMKLPREEVERRVDHALRKVGIEHLRKRNPIRLSGGQRRLAAIATVLSMEPNIMVLDEPTANLDWQAREEVIEIIRAFQHTCIVATHDLLLAAEVCEKALIIENGKVAAFTAMQRVLSDPALQKSIGIEKSINL